MLVIYVGGCINVVGLLECVGVVFVYLGCDFWGNIMLYLL